ncbi:hypothetical protein [Marinifilum fragile]|uniref:hypothetical protein n=1 Tax=Marinifilum fragile TaxID=570161 RepID=UPI0006D24F80|nr:hypothetical protein [Marinifilum fragile]
MKKLIFALLCMLGVIACQHEEVLTPQELEAPSPMEAYMGDTGVKSAAQDLALSSDVLDEMNEILSMEGKEYRVLMAEYITANGSNEVGKIVLAKHVGNKQLDADFVPNDERREWSGPNFNDITYAIDQTIDAVPPFGNVTAAETDAAIVRASDTWDALKCSNINFTRNPDYGIDIGVIAALYGFGGSLAILADVQHAGWRDIAFTPGVLGVTFTFIFTDANGPTDIDGNGKYDVAFREIYYDPFWLWNVDGTNIDVETIALHELGHGLSQAHFGNLSIKKDGTFKASPRAVMNALYFEPFTELQGADIGGHCSIWGEWPHN